MKALGMNSSASNFFNVVRTSLVRCSIAVWKRLNSHVSLYSLVVKLLPAHLNSWQETSTEQQLY